MRLSHLLILLEVPTKADSEYIREAKAHSRSLYQYNLTPPPENISKRYHKKPQHIRFSPAYYLAMTINPVARRFTNHRRQNPGLSDSVLLNSNNRTEFTSEPDVAVVGAGIIGLCYAIHLKNTSPHLNISVFEKSPAPMQKIGESTLSPFSKFSSGDMCPHDYFLRLFGLKDGLQFYCVDENDRKLSMSDCGGVDISYQLDRRVSELFFTMWAQKLGINVYHGAGCGIELPNGAGQAVTRFDDNVAPTSINPPQITLKIPMRSIGTTTNRINARLVCDASGFSRSLTGKFGNKEKLGP